jgi:hypothetical protein
MLLSAVPTPQAGFSSVKARIVAPVLFLRLEGFQARKRASPLFEYTLHQINIWWKPVTIPQAGIPSFREEGVELEAIVVNE